MNSLVLYFDAKTHDIQKREVTTKREIETEHIRFLAFRDIREGATLQRVILGRLGCTLLSYMMAPHGAMYPERELQWLINQERPISKWLSVG